MTALAGLWRDPTIPVMTRLLAALVVLLALAFGAAARADQDDPRLEALFARLLATHDRQEAREVELTIWRIWTEAGDPAVQQMVDMGLAAMAHGAYEEALADFDEVVEAAPHFAEGWNKRATVYYLMGRYDESMADIERTLALEPRHFGALSGLGLVGLALHDEAAALEAFEKALAVNPHMPGARKHYEELFEKLRGLRT